MQNKCWHALAKYHAITNVTFSEFLQFSSDFLKEMHIQGLVQGNISKEIALQANSKIIEILNFVPVPQKNITKVTFNQTKKIYINCVSSNFRFKSMKLKTIKYASASSHLIKTTQIQ